MRALFGLLVLAIGCKASAHVTAFVSDLQGRPQSDAEVFFTDSDGNVHSMTTDDGGKVAGEVEAGGTVWFNNFLSDPNEGATFDGYAEIQEGDIVQFGSNFNAAPGVVASMKVAPNAPSTVFEVQQFTTCGGNSQTVFPGLDFQARCGGVADVLFVGVDHQFADVSYAYVQAQPIVDGGTITVPSTAWRPLDSVSVAITAEANTLPVDLRNEFGVSGHPVVTGQTLTVSIPLVGTHMQLHVAAGSSTSFASDTYVDVPAMASQTVDVRSAMLPLVQVLTDPAGTWSVDDPTKLDNAWMVTSYAWQLASPTGGASVKLQVYAPLTAPGSIPNMGGAITSPAAQYNPTDALIQERVGLVRFSDDLPRSGALLNLDEFALGSQRSTYPFLPSASVAISALPH